MANEITINASLVYEDANGSKASISIADGLSTVTTKKPVANVLAVLTSETTINMGGLASVGWFMAKNLDTVNYIEIKDAASGHVVGKMFPGETYGPARLGSAMQAPVAIANTNTCSMEYVACAP